jgi:hypothetical protein
MEATTGKDIPARVAPYVYGVSVLIGLVYGGLATRARVPNSVLHKDTFLQLYVNSPYSSLLAGFIGLVWVSAWILFRFRKLRRWETAILCFFLGASASTLVVSLTLLAR